MTSTGDFTTTAQATDWDLIDNTASALSFDASGKTGILEIDTRNGAERVTMSGGLVITGDLTVTGDDITMGTNTDTAIMVADGTNFNPVVPSGVIDLANNGAFTVDNTFISSQTEITSGLAAADELLYSDGGTVKKIGLDNLVELAPALATEDAIANGDYILFLDGGASGNMNKEAVHDLATLFAGAGMTATNSVVNVIGGDGITANANDVAITPAQTTITSIYATDLIIGEDSQTAIDFGTADEIDFKINNATELTLSASSLYPVTTLGTDLGSAANEWDTLYARNMHLDFSPDAPADHAASGITATFRAGAGAAVAQFDLVSMSTTEDEIIVADADAYATSKVLGIALAAISDNAEGEVLLFGVVRDNDWTWTSGNTLYLHTGGTGSTISATAPSATGDFVVPIGYALSPDTIFFKPDMTLIEHA